MSTKTSCLIIHGLLVLTVIFLSMMFTSCQTNEADISTQISQIESLEDSTIEKMSPTSTVAVTLARPTITLSATKTRVNTASPNTPNTKIEVTPIPIQVIKESELPISGVLLAVSLDGKFVASVNDDVSEISVYDLRNDEIKWQQDISSYPLRPTTLAISSDGNFLATGGINEPVLVWDTNTDEIIHNFPTPYYTVDKVAFSQGDDILLATATESSEARFMMWDMASGLMIDTFPSQHTSEISIISNSNNTNNKIYGWNIGDASFISSQNNLLAMTVDHHSDQEVDTTTALYFWDIDNNQLKPILKGTWGRTLTTSSDGQLLAAEINEQIFVINTQTGQEIFNLLPTNSSSRRLAITNKGILAKLDRDGDVTIWNSEGKLLTTLNADQIISDIAFTSDGKLLTAFYSSSEDIPIGIWDLTE